MKSENVVLSNTLQTSTKRKDDVSVAELKSLPCFATYSDDELASIIEVAKIFSRAVVAIHSKETANRKTAKKATAIALNTNSQKKAA